MNRHSLLLLIFLMPLSAYSFNVDGNRWPDGEALFMLDIPGAAPSGISWNQSFEAALAEWNEATAFSFLVSDLYGDPCNGYRRDQDGTGFPAGEGDSSNGVDFGDTVCGNDFGQSVLAITLIFSASGQLGFSNITQTDIIYNNSVDWDIYNGRTRQEVDFGRVSLHELGHALGLGHENGETAIMAPTITSLDSLQEDDINGANAIYGGPSSSCEIPLVALHTVIEGRLEEGDCTVLELYNGGQDTSFIDAYRLILGEEQGLSISMESAVLDSVVLLTDTNLEGVEFSDDFNGTCDARISGNFPAGEYLILANTYDEPVKCAGNTGTYRLTVTDNSLPLLTGSKSLTGVTSRAGFAGGASADGGISYTERFAATDSIDINARILVDPEHAGKAGEVYVLAILGDGRRFVKNSAGNFTVFEGGISLLPEYVSLSALPDQIEIPVITDFMPETIGLSGTTINIFVGYALNGSPDNIYYNGNPVRMLIE